MTFVIVMGFHQIIVVMNDVKRHTYIQNVAWIYIYAQKSLLRNAYCPLFQPLIWPVI